MNPLTPPPPITPPLLPSLNPVSTAAGTSHDRYDRAVDNFRALVMKFAATATKPPLSSAQASVVEQRFRRLLPDLLHRPNHPPYSAMIQRAIEVLNEECGSSEESIFDFIKSKHDDLPWAHATLLKHHLDKLCESGDIVLTSSNCYLLTDSNLSPIHWPVPSLSDSQINSCSPSPGSSQSSSCRPSPLPKKKRRSWWGRRHVRLHKRSKIGEEDELIKDLKQLQVIRRGQGQRMRQATPCKGEVFEDELQLEEEQNQFTGKQFNGIQQQNQLKGGQDKLNDVLLEVSEEQSQLQVLVCDTYANVEQHEILLESELPDKEEYGVNGRCEQQKQASMVIVQQDESNEQQSKLVNGKSPEQYRQALQGIEGASKESQTELIEGRSQLSGGIDGLNPQKEGTVELVEDQCEVNEYCKVIEELNVMVEKIEEEQNVIEKHNEQGNREKKFDEASKEVTNKEENCPSEQQKEVTAKQVVLQELGVDMAEEDERREKRDNVIPNVPEMHDSEVRRERFQSPVVHRKLFWLNVEEEMMKYLDKFVLQQKPEDLHVEQEIPAAKFLEESCRSHNQRQQPDNEYQERWPDLKHKNSTVGVFTLPAEEHQLGQIQPGKRDRARPPKVIPGPAAALDVILPLKHQQDKQHKHKQPAKRGRGRPPKVKPEPATIFNVAFEASAGGPT